MKGTTVKLGLLGGLLMALCAAGAPEAAANGFEVGIATGAEGGVYRAVGAKLVELVNRTAPVGGVVRAKAIPSAGSVENLTLLREGKADFALCQADVLYEATQSRAPSAGTLRAVAGVMVEAVHVIVRNDAEVTTFDELQGYRVLAGKPGSGTAQTFANLLEAHSLPPNAVQRTYIADADAPAALLAGRIEAWIVTSAAPREAIRELLATGEVSLVPLTPDGLGNLTKRSPALRDGVIPKEAYGLEEDVPTIVVRTVLAASTNTSDEVVGEVLRSLVDQGAELGAVHPRAGEQAVEDRARDLPAPLHTGAIAFFRSRTALELPVKVYTGIFFVDISNLDLKNGTYIADFYVWFSWQGEQLTVGDEGFRFELMNGSIDAIDDATVERLGPWTYLSHRIRATLHGDFPLHSYPFDDQSLTIEFESPNLLAAELEFVPDNRNPFGHKLEERSLDEGLTISDWRVAGVEHRAATKVYKTDFGSPYEKASKERGFSRYVFEIKLARVLMPYVVKFCVPLIVIVLMSFSVFFINPKEFEVQAGIVIIALLSCVAFHLSQADALPEVGYLVTADKFFLLSYVVIFLTLVEVVAENYYFHRGDLVRAHRLDRVSRFLFPLMFFGPIAFMIATAL
ncbi:MAG: TAXI family TRAP transporter solute-binding subunit [Planctomycetota bacterium]